MLCILTPKFILKQYERIRERVSEEKSRRMR